MNLAARRYLFHGINPGECHGFFRSQNKYNVGPPFTIAKLVNITPITMVYGTYNYILTGVYQPTNITFGGPTLSLPFDGKVGDIAVPAKGPSPPPQHPKIGVFVSIKIGCRFPSNFPWKIIKWSKK